MAAKTKAAKKNRSKDKIKKARKVPVVDDSLRRLEAIEDAGKDIAAVKVKLEQADTLIAQTTAARKAAMTAKNLVTKELETLREEHERLSIGGFSERLHFPDPAKPAKSTTTSPAAVAVSESITSAPQSDPDAWKSLTLEQMGLTNKRALSALTAAGLDTFGKAEEHLGTAFSKPIPNFGQAARDAYDNAKEAYWTANPPPKAAPGEKHTAAGDKPGTASRGAAIERERAQLLKDVDNALAAYNQPVNDTNARSLLKKFIGSDPTASLAGATLDDVAKWRLQIKGADEGAVKSAIAMMA